MTVVIGLRLKHSLILASDGYAMYQSEIGKPIEKSDTYSKVQVCGDGRFAIGSAGSHQIAVDLQQALQSYKPGRHSEESFLEQFAQQVDQLNRDPDGRRAAFVLGYMVSGLARLVLFPVNSPPRFHEKLVTLGSGADVAADYLTARYDPDWSTIEAFNQVIDAVYAASSIPTVNFLPLAVVKTATHTVDLTQEAVLQFYAFRQHLKQSLVLTLDQSLSGPTHVKSTRI